MPGILGTRDTLTIKIDKVLPHITAYISERQIGVSITDHTIKYLLRQDTQAHSYFPIYKSSIANIIHKKKGGKNCIKIIWQGDY